MCAARKLIVSTVFGLGTIAASAFAPAAMAREHHEHHWHHHHHHHYVYGYYNEPHYYTYDESPYFDDGYADYGPYYSEPYYYSTPYYRSGPGFGVYYNSGHGW